FPEKNDRSHTASGSPRVTCRERCRRGSNASSPSCGAQHPPDDAAEVRPMDFQHESQGPSAKIATAVVQVLHEYTGRGPTKAKAMINENMVTVLLADT